MVLKVPIHCLLARLCSHTRFYRLLLGATRKLLGLTFEGETRDTDGMVWGDVEIQGLPSDVRGIVHTLFVNSLNQPLHHTIVLAHVGKTRPFHVSHRLS